MAKAKKKAAKPVKKATKKPTVKKSIKKSSAKPKAKAASKTATKSSKSVAVAAPAKKISNWTNILTPLDDRVIIELSEGERRTAGGLIIIPDTVSVSGNFQGKVLLVGRGHRDSKGRLRPMDVKPGDTILFSEFSGSKIEVMGSELKILRESEILGILEKQ